MSELSPVAQAVLDAAARRYGIDGDLQDSIAAALRAVADQCKVEWNYHPDYPETGSVVVVSDLLAIAAELDPIS